MGNYVYGLIMLTKESGYNKSWRRGLTIGAVASGVIMTVGISIPAYLSEDPYYQMLRSTHTAISTVGFFGFFLILLLISVTLFKRNKKQATIMLFLNGFTLIAGVFALCKVYDPTSYCHTSAPTQNLIFGLYNLNVTVCYILSTLTKSSVEEKLFDTKYDRPFVDR